MTSSAISAQGTIVQISTGTGGAKTISTVTVGYPTILTSTSHGFANGDVVVFGTSCTGTDAALINGKTATVRNVTTNTFAVDIDTTGKSITASSNTATANTYTAIANVRSFNNDGGSVNVIDKTNLASTAKEFQAGLIDFGAISLEVQLDNADAGQVAVDVARAASTTHNWKVILPSGSTPTASFAGFVTKFSKQGAVDSVVTGTIDIKITGAVTWA